MNNTDAAAAAAASPGPSVMSQLALPCFWTILCFTVPHISRHAINVRRALERYDAQTPALDAAKASEQPEQPRPNSGNRFSAQAFGRLMIGSAGAGLAVLILFQTQMLSAQDFLDGIPVPAILSISLGTSFSYRLFEPRGSSERNTYVRRTQRVPGTFYSVAIVWHTNDADRGSWWSVIVQSLVALARATLFGIIVFQTGLLLPIIVVIHRYFCQTSGALMRGGNKSLFGDLVLVTFGYALALVPFALCSWALKAVPDPTNLALVRVAAIGSLIIHLLFTLGPIYCVTKAACQYDLLSQRDGGPEAALSTEAHSLPVHEVELEESETPSMPSLLPFDVNGKRPEPVKDENVGSVRFTVATAPSKLPSSWLRRSAGSSESVQLPTFDCAVKTLQVLAGLALLYVLVCIHRSSQPHWLAQMQLGPLFSRALFEGGPRDSETALIHLLQASHFCIFLILSIVVSTHILLRHGKKGVWAFWFGGDEVETPWVEGPLQELFRPDPVRVLIRSDREPSTGTQADLAAQIEI
ncbi:hypothetical protein OC846_006158 [Tilletia horrida]|uniref:Uncharacterized protein n=1 Tax=Tilletia horrida TaxID=155126 RepID=A0AAN6JPK7_9BASI|nr:hypothetical protein OC846_006158 [Tilletia horrida]